MYTLEELDKIVDRTVFALSPDKEPKGLYDPIRYMLSIGGKRLRPKMCLLTYNLFSEQMDNSILYPAIALEMFHEYTLIHDDIMDNSDTRRGCLTVYRKWDRNTAILSGDTMSTEAFLLLSYVQAPYLGEALRMFSEMAIKVCEGQQYDMDFEDMPFITREDYLKMIGYKTSALIACSAELGALLGGASQLERKALYEYGWNIGIAFQIMDDYLDTFGDEKTFGKKIGGDIVNNKKTWLLTEAFRLASAWQRKSLQEILAMGEESRADKVEAMQQMYIELGVKETAMEEVAQCRRQVEESLTHIKLDESKKELLMAFAQQLIYREK